MKKSLFILLNSMLLVLFVQTIIGQAPQALNYQAVARDASGNVLVNKSVSFKINILQGSATGLNIYNELHAVTTNAFGLVKLNIGQGTSPSSVFANINWVASTYFVKVELDPLGGVSFYHMGTSQLLSVPYALLSRSVQDIPDNIVTNSKIANNAVTINKLPSGATATTFLRGDGTWQTPVSSGGSPAGISGSLQFNNGGTFGGAGHLLWNSTTNKLAIGENAPDSKLHISHNSSLTDAHLKLYEIGGDFARINFQNTSGTSYWSIAGLNHATNANELFNIYNSVSGNVISISGTGNTGINHVPDVVRKLYVDGENNGAGYFSNNSNSFNTLKVINQGSSAAGYFSNDGAEYTLYVKNLGTGPAALIDGSLQVAGGNSSEINRSQTGTANIVPVCYGSVEANGNKNTGGSTSNFTVTKVNTGTYDITITGETYAQNTHCAIATLGDVGFINTGTVAIDGKLRLYTFNSSAVLTDKEFSFVIYKP